MSGKQLYPFQNETWISNRGGSLVRIGETSAPIAGPFIAESKKISSLLAQVGHDGRLLDFPLYKTQKPQCGCFCVL